MDKEKLESLIIDYIDNKLTTAERQVVEQELVKNPDAYVLYEQLREVMQVMDKAARLEPTQKLSEGFERMLNREIRTTKTPQAIFFQPVYFRIAAAIAFLVVAAAVAFWVQKHNQQQEQIAELKQQMEQTKKMMMAMIDNQLSASSRIQGVNVAMQMKQADPEIVKVLYKTMTEDANSNVRLSALEALNKFSYDPSVRSVLINSLTVQSDPVVQIALIQILVQMNEKSVVDDLQKIVDDAGTMKAVKDEAYSGILKLS